MRTDLVQIHPLYGERRVCALDGLADIAEIDDVLFVVDLVHIMGDREGTVALYDPDTLTLLVHASIDRYTLLAFDGPRFVVSEPVATDFRTQAWSWPDCRPLGAVQRPDPQQATLLKPLLTGVHGLAEVDGRVTRALPREPDRPEPPAPPPRPPLPPTLSPDQVRKLAPSAYDHIIAGWKDAEVVKVEVVPDGPRLAVTIHARRPALLIGRRGAEALRLKDELRTRLQVEIVIHIVEVREPKPGA